MVIFYGSCLFLLRFLLFVAVPVLICDEVILMVCDCNCCLLIAASIDVKI